MQSFMCLNTKNILLTEVPAIRIAKLSNYITGWVLTEKEGLGSPHKSIFSTIKTVLVHDNHTTDTM